MTFNSGEETVYPDGIVFSQLENLKVYICSENWSKLLVHLLKDSPHLRILDLEVYRFREIYGEYEQVSWGKNQGSVPKCFLNSLETFKFKGYNSDEQEDRDFMSLIFKHARCLKSTSILHRSFVSSRAQTLGLNILDGNEVFFRIKRSTQLKKLMNAYCDRQSVDMNSIAFLFDGRRLRAEQTPDELEMEDGDEIDAMLHQTGGRGGGAMA
ncbi:unnamed protein product [Arabidopsis arenosa]|uniref:Ubiquitin-like domain-containing protein n=1 Tax=Arabidopsis arenosa TaxID=38785 RepID=A0A8S2B9M9_ARAAE|nr:unnamed protein product [Arabidopsis arenosa]